jgi:hypothetical protein
MKLVFAHVSVSREKKFTPEMDVFVLLRSVPSTSKDTSEKGRQESICALAERRKIYLVRRMCAAGVCDA